MFKYLFYKMQLSQAGLIANIILANGMLKRNDKVNQVFLISKV